MGFLASIHLTPEQKEKRRLAGLAMLRAGKSQAAVARELGVTDGAVNRWAKAAKTGGAKALRRRPHTGRRPKLDAKVLAKLPDILVEGAEAHGFETDVWTLERVATVISRKFRVTYHPHHVSKLLHKLGLTWKKPRRRANNRDDAAIAAWVREEWPRLKNAQRSSEP